MESNFDPIIYQIWLTFDAAASWGQIEIKPQEYIDIYSQIYIFLERDREIESYELPEDWGVKQVRKQTHVKDWTLVLI